jgi:hypothetical protein
LGKNEKYEEGSGKGDELTTRRKQKSRFHSGFFVSGAEGGIDLDEPKYLQPLKVYPIKIQDFFTEMHPSCTHSCQFAAHSKIHGEGAVATPSPKTIVRLQEIRYYATEPS